jgi:hypothetical protein
MMLPPQTHLIEDLMMQGGTTPGLIGGDLVYEEIVEEEEEEECDDEDCEYCRLYYLQL